MELHDSTRPQLRRGWAMMIAMTIGTRAGVRLIDDHEIIGVALEHALAGSQTLRYLDRADTVACALSAQPAADIAVLDLRLADESSPVQNVHALSDAGCTVVVYTSGESPYLIRLAAQAPIAGLVRKSAPLTELVTALKHCAQGDLAFSTDWAAAILGDQGLDQVGLSPREREVLVLLAAGVPTKAAAAQLGIAIPTLEVHLARLRDKYARIGRPAQQRSDLVLRALEDGYLPLPYEPPAAGSRSDDLGVDRDYHRSTLRAALLAARRQCGSVRLGRVAGSCGRRRTAARCRARQHTTCSRMGLVRRSRCRAGTAGNGVGCRGRSG